MSPTPEPENEPVTSERKPLWRDLARALALVALVLAVRASVRSITAAGVPWWALVLALAFPVSFGVRLWRERRRLAATAVRWAVTVVEWVAAGPIPERLTRRRRRAPEALPAGRAHLELAPGGDDDEG